MADKKLSFEKSIEELELIAGKLESDNLTLDESVKIFEKGMKLSKECKKMLDAAEKKITILIGDEEKEFKSEE